MANYLNFVTLNIRGLGGKQKSKVVLDWLRNNSKGVTFLQETHSDENLSVKWQKYWKGDLYCSHGNTNSKGVAILFHPTITPEVIDKFEDRNGRYLIMRVKLLDEIFVFANCYLPTKNNEREQCAVLRDIVDILNNFTDETLVIGGDFNIALNPYLEKNGGRIELNESKNFRSEMNGMLLSLKVEDIIRNTFPDSKLFTWHNKTKGISSRLDYWFLSENLLNRVRNCKIQTALYTDHDLVRFSLSPLEPSDKRGPGYWKFNASYISDHEYVTQIKATIKDSFNSVKEYEDKGFVWDYVKMQLRNFSMKYSKTRSAEQRRLELCLNSQLSALQEEYNAGGNIVKLEEISVIKKELESIQTNKTNGAIIRSKIQNIEVGEKNTAYFLALEKKNSATKSITHLKRPDNSIATGKDDVSSEILSFYEHLYAEPDVLTDMYDHEFLNNGDNVLFEQEQSNCDGLITEAECLSALKKLKNGKTPGIDGLPAEFYKLFWIDIKEIVLSSLNFAFAKNELSLDQRRGLISLVPKKDKDRQFLKNWRPIALLTTDYKLIAKCLAARIVTVIDKLIAPDQTGYIKGRYIGENIRTVHDMITYLKLRNKSGILLLIDFEKAFDTVRWSFIDKALQIFNFGNSFRKWVQVLYTNIESAVLNNGFLTKFFAPQRGVRQGCPLSVYLFILVAELLAINIRGNKEIKGIQVKNREIKISQLADDTSIFINDPHSIEPIFQTLRNFSACSGLKANVDKTKLYNIGSTDILEHDLGIFSFAKDDIVLLGITITTDEKKSVDKNFAPRLKAIHNILKQWSRRKLSLKGKITIINALALSLIVYPASVLYTPINVLEEINKLLFDFLWDGKRPKIAAKIMENSIKLGGLKMPNIFLKVKAWTLSWLQRAIIKPENNWVIIVNELLPNMRLPDLLNCDIDLKNPFLETLPNFYRNIIHTWFSMKPTFSPDNEQNIHHKTLWLNKNVTVNGKDIFWANWYKKGILYVKDILNANNHFMSADELHAQYGVSVNFLSALQIRQALPYNWRQYLKRLNVHDNTEPQILLKFKSKPIPFIKYKTSQFYQMLIELQQNKNLTQPKCIDKWNETFNIDINAWEEIFQRPFRVCRSTRLQSFQFRLLHRVITCNHWLFNAHIKDSPICDTCLVDDSLFHFFIECIHVQEFWRKFKLWWERITLKPFLLCPKEILFGVEKPNPHFQTLNFVLFLANKFIHDHNMVSRIKVSFLSFLGTLRIQLQYEKQICVKNGDYNVFETKWNWLYQQLN